MIQTFNIGIITESNVGLIIRIATMISRRRIHIESLEVSSCAEENIYQFLLTVRETGEAVSKLMLQIDKQVEVFKTFYNTDQGIVLDGMRRYLQDNLVHSKKITAQFIPEEIII